MNKTNTMVLDLIDHTTELTKAKELLSKVNKEIKWHGDTKAEVTFHKKKTWVYLVDAVLGAVADMSLTRFEVRDQMEEYYKLTYLKSPELGKTLFFDHYDEIHKPYDMVKNKCFDLLGKLDPYATIVETI